MRIERLLAIILILLKRRKVTAPELARELGVSVRTIYRDVDAVAAAGIPIVSMPGTGGGIGILDTYKLDRQVLTPDEMLSILGALRGVGAALGDGRLVHAGRKIEALLPDGEAARLEDELHVDLLPWAQAARDGETLRTLRAAVRERCLARFAYPDTAGGFLERTVEPMTLVLKGTVWYLFAYCRLRADYRLFRLSRIRELRVDGERFERREMRYLDFARRREPWQARPLVSLVLRFEPRMRRMVEDLFSPGEITPEEDGRLLVRTCWPEDEWVHSTLLGYGPDMEVLAPPHLRDLVRDRAQATSERYSQPEKPTQQT